MGQGSGLRGLGKKREHREGDLRLVMGDDFQANEDFSREYLESLRGRGVFVTGSVLTGETIVQDPAEPAHLHADSPKQSII